MLSRRQFEFAALIAEGLHNKEIAARLNVTPSTVRAHSMEIYKECGFLKTWSYKRVEFAVWWIRRGWKTYSDYAAAARPLGAQHTTRARV
jgi:DNA-binding NarL/FixJ family response regulator